MNTAHISDTYRIDSPVPDLRCILMLDSQRVFELHNTVKTIVVNYDEIQ